jgi:alcohol dehydrogenase class IV
VAGVRENERRFTLADVGGRRVIRFGDGVRGEVPDLLRSHGFDGPYALLTTPRWRDAVPALVEGAAVVLDVPPGGVPEASAAVRDEVARRNVVALGGGRVVDSAKAIAGADGVDCAAIPTTLSGAELTGFHRLPAGADGGAMVRPSLVVADPALMASQPMPALAASAMNALAHAVEALYTPLANPVAGAAALRAAELIAGALLAGDEPDREAVALGALLAGYASGMTGYAVHHVVCQTIVRVGGTPHAETNATMLPHVVRLMSERAPAVIGELEQAVGGADAFDRLAARAGTSGLRSIGFDPEKIENVVSAVAGRAELRNTPDPPGEDELRRLVESAL